MKYEILSGRTEMETLIATTKITFNDESDIVVDVLIYSPESIEQVDEAICNRAQSEQERQNRIAAIANIVPILPIGEVKNI